MRKPIPFTELSLKRAIAAADKAGKRLVVQPDGSLSFEEKTRAPATQPEIDLEQEQDVVL